MRSSVLFLAGVLASSAEDCDGDACLADETSLLQMHKLRESELAPPEIQEYLDLLRQAPAEIQLRQTQPSYELGEQGGIECPTRSVKPGRCLKAVQALSDGDVVGRLRVGKWDHVPAGCSRKGYTGNFKAFYNRGSGGGNGGAWRPVCEAPEEPEEQYVCCDANSDECAFCHWMTGGRFPELCEHDCQANPSFQGCIGNARPAGCIPESEYVPFETPEGYAWENVCCDPSTAVDAPGDPVGHAAAQCHQCRFFNKGVGTYCARDPPGAGCTRRGCCDLNQRPWTDDHCIDCWEEEAAEEAYVCCDANDMECAFCHWKRGQFPEVCEHDCEADPSFQGCTPGNARPAGCIPESEYVPFETPAGYVWENVCCDPSTAVDAPGDPVGHASAQCHQCRFRNTGAGAYCATDPPGDGCTHRGCCDLNQRPWHDDRCIDCWEEQSQ